MYVYLIVTVFSRMWTLPEASEVAVPNERRGKESELKAGDCSIRKVINSLDSVLESISTLKCNLMPLNSNVLPAINIRDPDVMWLIDPDANLCTYVTRFKENTITATCYISQTLTIMHSMCDHRCFLSL